MKDNPALRPISRAVIHEDPLDASRVKLRKLQLRQLRLRPLVDQYFANAQEIRRLEKKHPRMVPAEVEVQKIPPGLTSKTSQPQLAVFKALSPEQQEKILQAARKLP